MKLTSRLLPLLLVAFSAVAQDAPPTVTSIEPRAASSSGGVAVTFTGSGFRPTVVCILPCPPTVTFGDVTVIVDEQTMTDTRFVVSAPAHAPGVVDVIVSVPGRDPLRISNAFTFLSRTEDNYEKVLFPIYIDGAIDGTFGSRWTTSLWMRNAGPAVAALAPFPCLAQVCPPVFPLTYSLEPGAMRHNLPDGYAPAATTPARLLYVWRAASDQVRFGLRVADISRAGENAGTDIPVVRESEFATRAVDLYEIPMKSDFRVLLRVYEMSYATSTFTVNVYPMSFTATAPIVSFPVVALGKGNVDFNTEPSYAQWDLTSLMELDSIALPESVRVEVVPQTPGSRFWAFASITNNTTQLVTTSTPQ